ncbi:UNVERIFIED_CONTAM: Calcium-transporting ATPase 4, plasma membrane-type [Sesamum radiatum]|uniref:Calcium-transporting ATPase n=1 Tax=Sesamum radiatum TaxID=300843 RepID=A0AAW2UB84_SESRA
MYDGVGIILCIFLVVMVTAISDYKQSLQFRDLDKEKRNIFVHVTRNRNRQKVAICDLVVGDIVNLSMGDQVPADGLYISGYSLAIDESSLSGESDLVIKEKERPFLLSGTKVQDGSGIMLVTSVVTILVVAVPEGLPLAVTLSLAFAMKKLMNDRALVRHLSACETMGSASCICTDKTGTLTTNHMVVTKIWTCGEEKRVENNRPGNPLSSSISEKVTKTLMHAIFLNTGAEVVKGKDGKTEILGSPTETALLELGLLFQRDFRAQRKEAKTINVEPFNSVKKKMSVLVMLPGGSLRAFLKGASEVILGLCDKILGKDGDSVPMSEEQRKHITNVINGFACEALRTICLAFKDADKTSEESIPENNYTLIAVVGIKDPVRPGVKEAVKTCLAAGIVVRMVTGDNINTAKAIAKECGILTDDGIAIEGSDFRDKSTQEMKELIPKLQVMARSLPMDKHKLVTILRKECNEVVAVTGDGTNDAPALHEADIGLAMGIAGTEVAKESADVVIMDDNFTTIVTVAKWGRSVYINIQKFVQFQLTVNIVALMTNFFSACIAGSAPLTAVQLLWVNMIMDTLGALALATEPPHDGLMKQPPLKERALHYKYHVEKYSWSEYLSVDCAWSTRV